MNKLALALTIVGGINWGLVALASLWCIGLLVRLRGEEMA